MDILSSITLIIFALAIFVATGLFAYYYYLTVTPVSTVNQPININQPTLPVSITSSDVVSATGVFTTVPGMSANLTTGLALITYSACVEAIEQAGIANHIIVIDGQVVAQFTDALPVLNTPNTISFSYTGSIKSSIEIQWNIGLGNLQTVAGTTRSLSVVTLG